MTEKPHDIRCGACNRKLGEGEYIRLCIKCPRCGVTNNLSAPSAFSDSEKESTRGYYSPTNP